MAGEYDINLSNGTVLATLYPLETNGPDNRSTPRLIQQTKPSFAIIQIPTVGLNGVFQFSGDVSGYFPIGSQFDVVDTGSPISPNVGTYTVANLPVPGSGSPGTFGAWYDSSQDETNVIVTGTISDADPSGAEAVLNAFVLNSDLTYRFVAGFTFDVQNSGGFAGSPLAYDGNDGTYTVTSFGSYLAGTVTVIPVDPVGSPPGNIPSTALPLGQIQYTVFVNSGSPQELNTSLSLPGRGVVNYGESIIENLVRMTENFAADVAPELNVNIGSNPVGTPLVGQWWYKTLAGEEGFKFWDGTQWTSNQDIDDGALVFRDIENPNGVGSPLQADIYVTGSETNLPAPWVCGSPDNCQAGLVVWTQVDPPNNEPIFRVLSSDGTERLRVEHHNPVGDAFVRTINSLEVKGNLGIEINSVQAVGSPPGYDATLKLNAPTGQRSEVLFETQGVQQAEVYADSGGLNLRTTDNLGRTISIIGGNANVAYGQGDDIVLTGGSNSANSSYGGPINLTAGSGRGPSGNTSGGASCILYGGNNAGTPGAAVLRAANGTVGYSGGSVSIQSGAGGPTGDAGSINITAGNAGGGTTTYGGDVTLDGGGFATVNGGQLKLFGAYDFGGNTYAGGVQLSVPTASWDGSGSLIGGIRIFGGDNALSGGSGGRVTIRAGAANTGVGTGGYVRIQGGQAAGATQGGDIQLLPGQGSANNSGHVLVTNAGKSSTPFDMPEIRFVEGNTPTNEYIGIRGKHSVTSSVTYTLPELPAGSPFPTQFLTTNESGILSWADPLAATSGSAIFSDLAQTVGATTADLLTTPVPENEPVTFTVRGHGVDKSGSPITGDVYSAVIEGCISTKSGTATIIGAPAKTVFNDAGAAAWDISVVVSGGDLIVRVTGEAGKTIDWNVRIDLIRE